MRISILICSVDFTSAVLMTKVGTCASLVVETELSFEEKTVMEYNKDDDEKVLWMQEWEPDLFLGLCSR